MTAFTAAAAMGACTALHAGTSPDSTALARSAATMAPHTQLKTLASELATPSDLQVTDGGVVLLTMADQIVTVTADGTVGTLSHDLPDLATDAPALLDLAFGPNFPRDPNLLVCYRTSDDIRVVRLRVNSDLTFATQAAILVTGIPLPPDGASGCRMAIGPDGYLYIGTTDGQEPTAPQDLTAKGGKILRVDASTGAPAPDNPLVDRQNPTARMVFSYGHRAIEGLDWHPTTNALYAVDRGPGREDEVNKIVAGGNYGWDPASASSSSYLPDEVAMTDLTISTARPAAWNSGTSDVGLSAAQFITGSQWGMFTGNLVVASGTRPNLTLLPITGDVVGQPTSLETSSLLGPALALGQDPMGAFYLGTANGRHDRLLRLQVTETAG